MIPLLVTSVQFTEYEVRLLEALKESTGLNRTAVLRTAIRLLAETRGVTVPSAAPVPKKQRVAGAQRGER